MAFSVLKRILFFVLLALLAGITSGFAVGLFVLALDLSADFHRSHREWVLALPLFGALLGFLSRFYSHPEKSETGQILQEIRSPEHIFPLRFGPLVFLSSVLTQIGGASAGREGAAVQIAAAFSDQWSRWIRLDPIARARLLTAGIAAGFAGALGTPIAAALFAIEIQGPLGMDRLRKNANQLLPALWISLLASAIGAATSFFIRARLRSSGLNLHSFSPLQFFGLREAAAALGVGLISVILVRGFFLVQEGSRRILGRISRNPIHRGGIAGLVLCALYGIGPFDAFRGLGIAELELSFHQSASPLVPVLKLAFTAWSLAGGFKGGEFIPLFFIGASAGSALSGVASGLGIHLSLSIGDFAALGCVAAFGGASRMPVTCLILGIELFGMSIAPGLLVALAVTRMFPPKKSIYST
jgi:H+/Cl- antiporter ClcA